jgi:hypothetical protein
MLYGTALNADTCTQPRSGDLQHSSGAAAAALSIAIVQVFQSAILEAKKYKASGGDALADVLDLLSTRAPSGPGAAAKEGTGREEVRPLLGQLLCMLVGGF